MIKLGVAIVIFVFLMGCGGVRYTWVPKTDDRRPPSVEYEGTGIQNPENEF